MCIRHDACCGTSTRCSARSCMAAMRASGIEIVTRVDTRALERAASGDADARRPPTAASFGGFDTVLWADRPHAERARASASRAPASTLDADGFIAVDRYQNTSTPRHLRGRRRHGPRRAHAGRDRGRAAARGSRVRRHDGPAPALRRRFRPSCSRIRRSARSACRRRRRASVIPGEPIRVYQSEFVLDVLRADGRQAADGDEARDASAPTSASSAAT